MAEKNSMASTLQWMEESRKQQQENHQLIQELWKNNTKKLDEIYEMLKAYRDQVLARTILVQIHWEIFPISCKELDMVFSRFGDLEYLEKMSPGMEFHSKVHFKTEDSALQALNFLNGKNIYDGCCRLELSIEVPPEGSKEDLCKFDGSTSKIKEDLCKFEPPVEATTRAQQIQETDFSKYSLSSLGEKLGQFDHGVTVTWLEGPKMHLKDNKGSSPFEGPTLRSNTIGINNDIPSTDSSQAQLQVMSNSSLETVDFDAHQVFDKMPKVNFGCLAIVLPNLASVDTAGVVKPLGFGWRRIDHLSSTEFVAINICFDPGGMRCINCLLALHKNNSELVEKRVSFCSSFKLLGLLCAATLNELNA